MTRRFPLGFKLLLLAMLCGIGCTRPPTNATVYVYRLDGEYYDKAPENEESPIEPPANNVHEWPILESKQITDSRLAAELCAAIADARNFGGNDLPDCFWPGMAIAIDDGEKTEAIICLKCDRVKFYRGGRDADEKNLSERGHQEFARLFAMAFPEQPKPPQ
ncbi:MAG TPA: hypothetical protein VJ783_14070 [Pirellulales bacterium]|nr:hypothetical protein [Pirellulales bacterium]